MAGPHARMPVQTSVPIAPITAGTVGTGWT